MMRDVGVRTWSGDAGMDVDRMEPSMSRIIGKCKMTLDLDTEERRGEPAGMMLLQYLWKYANST